MSHWNRAYLDALEVPVWVPLDDQVEENADAKIEPSKPNSLENSASIDATALEVEQVVTPHLEADYLRFLEGEPSADFVFLIPKNADPVSSRASFRQLELAWKAWLDQPFTAAIAQLSEQSEQAQLVESCPGTIILCGAELAAVEHPSVQAPSLDSLQNQKKEWWGLLQRLH